MVYPYDYGDLLENDGWELRREVDTRKVALPSCESTSMSYIDGTLHYAPSYFEVNPKFQYEANVSSHDFQPVCDYDWVHPYQSQGTNVPSYEFDGFYDDRAYCDGNVSYPYPYERFVENDWDIDVHKLNRDETNEEIKGMLATILRNQRRMNEELRNECGSSPNILEEVSPNIQFLDCPPLDAWREEDARDVVPSRCESTSMDHLEGIPHYVIVDIKRNLEDYDNVVDSAGDEPLNEFENLGLDEHVRVEVECVEPIFHENVDFVFPTQSFEPSSKFEDLSLNEDVRIEIEYVEPISCENVDFIIPTHYLAPHELTKTTLPAHFHIPSGISHTEETISYERRASGTNVVKSFVSPCRRRTIGPLQQPFDTCD